MEPILNGITSNAHVVTQEEAAEDASTAAMEPTSGCDVVPSASVPTAAESVAERIGVVMHLWRPTVVQSFASFGMGLLLSIFGSTLVHMSLLLRVSITKMSFALTFESVGIFMGSVLCGLVTSCLDYDFVTAVTVLLGGFSTILAPLLFGFPGFLASMTLKGVAGGFFNPHIVIYCLSTWKNHRFRSSALQAQYLLNALGATAATFMINSFLINLTPTPPATVDNSTFVGIDDVITSPNTDQRQPGTIENEDSLERVIYAFVVVGLITVLCGIPAVVVFVCRGPPRPCLSAASRQPPAPVESPPVVSDTPTVSVADQPRRRMVAKLKQCRLTAATASASIYTVIIFLIGFFCGPCEVIPWSYMIAFAIKQLSWSSNDAAQLLTVLAAAHCIGRLIGVPLGLLPPGRILIGQAVLTIAGITGLLVAGIYPSTPAAVVWIGIAAVGVGLSTFLGLMFLILFDDRYVNLIGADNLSSTVCVGSCVGSATSALMVGYLLDNWTPMVVIYSMGGSLGCLLVVLGIRLAVVGKLHRLASTPTNCDDENKDDESATEITPLFSTDSEIQNFDQRCDTVLRASRTR